MKTRPLVAALRATSLPLFLGLLLAGPSAIAQAPVQPAAPVAPEPPKHQMGGDIRIDLDSHHHNRDTDALTPEILAKLDGDQLAEVLKRRASADDEHESPLAEFGVPVAFFVFLTIIVVANLYSGYRKDRSKQETLRLMVEKGAQIPVELIQPPPKRTNDLRRGLLLLTAGLGLVLFLAILNQSPRLWSVGLVPVLLGTGYLAAWRIESSTRRPS
jgi:hypothetical protein